MKFNEIINEDRQQLNEFIPWFAIGAAGMGYTGYEIYNNFKLYNLPVGDPNKISGEDLTARLGGDVATALIGGGLIKGLQAGIKSYKMFKSSKDAVAAAKNLKKAENDFKKLDKNSPDYDKNLKKLNDKKDLEKLKLDTNKVKKAELNLKPGKLKTLSKNTKAFGVPAAITQTTGIDDTVTKAFGGTVDKDGEDSKDSKGSKGSKDSKVYDRYISSLKKGMSAADKAKYGNTDIKYDRNKSPETKAVFDKYSALGAKGLDYNKDNKIVKPDVKKVKTDVKKVKPDVKTVKTNKDIKYDRNADVTQGSTISQKPVVKFNPVNQKPITNPNPTTVKDKDTGGIINKNIDKDFIEKNMPGKTLNKKGVIVKKEDVVEDFVSEENKTTKYQFLNNELAEAKYMRTDRDTIGRSSDNIAQGFFEHLLVLQQMRFENPTWAQKYAKDTMRYMSFNNVRTGATDLHNLASIVNNPAKYASKIGNSSATINELGFKRYLRNIINGKYVPGQDRAFFLATQKSLGIKNSLLKQARRVMSDYGVTNKNERASVSTRLTNSFRQDSRYRSDVFKPYASTIKKNKVMPPEKKGMGIAAKTAIGMVGGAVAGYKLGQWASS